jgi:NADH dehydrogenase
VTLIDRHNYQQFQPLLYQVATAELGTTDIARPIRRSSPRTEPSRCVSST